jgi:ferredoxin
MTHDTPDVPGLISIVNGKCIGAGNCVEIAESYFDQDDDTALVVVRQHHVEPGDRALVRRAINVCPVAAIVMADAPVA